MRRRIVSAVLALALLALAPAASWAGTQATSNSTVADIVTKAQAIVNDSSSEFASSAEWMRWIDEAVKQVALIGRCLEGTANATVYSGQMSYSLGVDTLDIETVLYDDGVAGTDRYTMLDKIDPKDLYAKSRGSSSGRPALWFQWGSAVNLWPVPGDDQNGTSITAFYVANPAALTSTTSAIPTPYYFDSAIALYAAAKFYEKDSREAKAVYYKNLFYQEVERFRNDIRKNLSTAKAQQ